MKISNRILKYLCGDRRGKEANSLEREALNDAFLYEALEGLTEMQGDPVRDIELLSKRLKARTRETWRLGGKSWWWTAAVGVIGLAIWGLFQQTEFVREQSQEEALPLAENGITGKEVRDSLDKGAVVFVAAPDEQNMENAGEDTVKMQARMIPRAMKLATVTLAGEDSIMKENRGSVPFGGYKKFYHYIQDSLRYPEDAILQGLEGNIKLSFYVNKAGRPSHIRVVEWITYSCNREAIRLLNEGPAWNYTGDTSYVVIPFRLKK